MAFQLIAGHPALDLVNTLDWRFRAEGPEELLKNYGELLRFCKESGLPALKRARHGAGAGVLRRCIELREAIAGILYARLEGRDPSTRSLKTLERYIKAANIEQRLRWKHGRLEWAWNQADAESPVWALSLSAADLLQSVALENLRECGNSECRWLFLDTSKNHTRRWCDMKICGNRMKARRFKALRKG